MFNGTSTSARQTSDRRLDEDEEDSGVKTSDERERDTRPDSAEHCDERKLCMTHMTRRRS